MFDFLRGAAIFEHMRNVLIIHHLEPMWESGYRRFGTSFDELQEKVVEFLSENPFGRVILTRFEDWRASCEDGYCWQLLNLINEVQSYAYGWEANCLEEFPDRFCKGGNHSEAVLIDDWIVALRGCNVTICGAFDGECIEDLEIALRHVGIDFKREESLIVG